MPSKERQPHSMSTVWHTLPYGFDQTLVFWTRSRQQDICVCIEVAFRHRFFAFPHHLVQHIIAWSSTLLSLHTFVGTE